MRIPPTPTQTRYVAQRSKPKQTGNQALRRHVLGHRPSSTWNIRRPGLLYGRGVGSRLSERFLCMSSLGSRGEDQLDQVMAGLAGGRPGRPSSAGSGTTGRGQKGRVRGCYFTVTVIQSLISTWVPSVLITRKTMSN
jgi:hypothetical protein